MLGDFINFESFVNPDKKNWAFDPETIFYNGSEPTVTVSSRDPHFGFCDICHCKRRQLHSLHKGESFYFLCYNCYKEVHKSSSKLKNNFIDLSNLIANRQLRKRLDEINSSAGDFVTPGHKKIKKKKQKNK